MKANRVSGTNIKGQSFSHELKPITIIAGDNGKGKSAIISALKLAANGYDPRLGQRKTFKLSSGISMAAIVHFEDGRTNTAEFTLRRGSVKTDCDIQVPLPAVMLDFSTFTKMSGPDQRRFLFTLASAGMNFDAAELVAEVRKIKPADPRPAHDEAMMNLVEAIQAADEARLEMNVSLDEFFQSLTAQVKTSATEAKQAVKMMTSSLRGSVALEAQQGVAFGRPGIDGEVQANQKLAATLTAFLDGLKTRQDQNDALVKARADAQEQLEKIQVPTDVQILEASNEAKRMQRIDTVNQEILTEAKTRADIIEKLQRKIESTREALNRARDAERDAEGALGHVCNTCGAAPEHWSADAKQRAKKYHQATRVKADGLQKELTISEKQVRQLAETAKANGDDKARARADQSAGELANLRGFLKRLQDAKVNGSESIAAAKQVLDANSPLTDSELAQKCHAKILETGARLPATVPASMADLRSILQGVLDETEASLEKLKKEQLTENQAKARRAQHEQAKAELEAQEATSEILDAALVLMAEREKKIVRDGIAGVLARGGALTNAVFGFPLEFQNDEIGYVSDGKWVSHETFSGLEAVLAYAGLSVAFAPQSPCKLILIDEILISRKNKRTLIDRARAMINGGLIDNFIMVDVDEDDYVFHDDMKLISV
jgi:uncharacterized protein YgiM (DUF1202 family)